MLTLLREVSLRHLRHSPFRTALVVLGIALGVCMLCAIVATNRSLIAAFEDMVDRVAGKADLTVAGSEAGVPSEMTAQIAEVDGVEHAAAMLEVVTRTPKGDGGAILVLGVDFLGDTFFLPFQEENKEAGKKPLVEDPLIFVNEPKYVLASKKLAEARGLEKGSTLDLMTSEGSKEFEVYAVLEDEGPAASFGGQVVVMAIDSAQVMFSRGYNVDRIDVVIDPAQELTTVQDRIQAQVGDTARVEAPKGRTQRLVGGLAAFQNGLAMTGMVALFVGMFLIYNSVAVTVAQRRREVGVLRALGVTKRRMVALFCIEALIMACFGVVLGLLGAQYLADSALESVRGSVSKFVMQVNPPPPEIDNEVIAMGVIAGFLTTLVASYLPAKRTNKVDPAEALRSTRSTSTSMQLPSGMLALIGLALCALAILPATQNTEVMGYLSGMTMSLAFVLMVPMAIGLMRKVFVGPVERMLGIPGRLALDNVERSLGRSAITVIALMLAVSLSVSLGAYIRSFEASVVQWADDAFPADIMVTAGSPTVDNHAIPFAPTVVDKLQGMEGVLAVSPVRMAKQDVMDHRSVFMATDTRTYFEQAQRKQTQRQLVEGAPYAPALLTEKPTLMISENMSALTDLHPGDSIELTTPSGHQTFEIVSVVVDYNSDHGWAMLDMKWYREFWKEDLVDQLDIFLADPSHSDAVAQEVRKRLGETEALFVTPNEQLREEIRGAAASLFAYAKAPEMVTLIVAIMGVIGTMLAAVLDRIREVGMLRAIGATRRQVINSVVVEAGFLGFAAALWGVAAGIPQGIILTKVIGHATAGWNLSYTFPTEAALRVSLLVAGTAALAGWLPGRNAAAMDVKEALAYE